MTDRSQADDNAAPTRDEVREFLLSLSSWDVRTIRANLGHILTLSRFAGGIEKRASIQWGVKSYPALLLRDVLAELDNGGWPNTEPNGSG